MAYKLKDVKTLCIKEDEIKLIKTCKVFETHEHHTLSVELFGEQVYFKAGDVELMEDTPIH